MPPLTLGFDDLAPFADLGTMVQTGDAGFILVRNGVRTAVEVQDAGYVVQEPDGAPRSYSSAGAVLSSEAFGDLSRIARNQAIVLGSLRITGVPVPITSDLKEVSGSVPVFFSRPEQWKALDRWLHDQQQSQNHHGTDLLLIDGPAGVGKTTIVREAALLRAESYDGSLPLIMQIASRGRVLQNIGDLIAFSLQDVRANLTIGQLIVLIRFGLVTMAIDGFDELSDPNGFQTAWSGLNTLIADARGAATFLLAGRETFVSTETIRRQLTSFDPARDRLSTLSLSDPEPYAAREWLLTKDGWDSSLLGMEFVEPIFVKDSYALRPFFLDVIAREPEALRSDELPASDLLSYLVDVMTQREAEKFVESLDPPNGRDATKSYGVYVGRFLEEVARDMADNQSDAIADEALDLLATVAAHGVLPEDQIAAVVQRARSVVFLANDVQVGHVRFAHEQLQQHFLSREALRSVGEGETPRYVRRNLFGREALEVFAHVARGRAQEAQIFLRAVRAGIGTPSRDRTDANLSTLGIAAACGAALDNADLRIKNVGLSELHFPFSPPPGISIQDTVVSILHAASADLRTVQFKGGVDVATLVVDRRTLLPSAMPIPHTLISHKGSTADRDEIVRHLHPDLKSESSGMLTWSVDLAELLGRIERYRPFWLRTNIEDTDRQGRRIIAHEDWPALFEAVKDLDLVTIKSRQAAGVRADFVHFRQDVRLAEHAGLHHALGGSN